MPEVELPATRKVPGAYASDKRRLRTMYLDNHLFTGKRSYKRQKRKTQLDEYLDTLLGEKSPPELLSTTLTAGGQESANSDIHWSKKWPWITSRCPQRPTTAGSVSSAKRTVICDRTHLSPAVIEAHQLQKNWLRRSAVPIYLTTLTEYIVKKDG
ncbi:hypothetical protein PSPO01_15735 [Paraphaeosphaeria sporulosa]